MTFPWDSINNIETTLLTLPKDENGKLDPERCADEILDFLIFTYILAHDNIEERFNVSLEIKAEDMRDIIYKDIAGEDFTQRARKWAEEGKPSALNFLLETETNRVFNEAMLLYADKAGAGTKTWRTMEDDRVRDTHLYLSDMELPIDGMFFTYDGDGAEAPGGFLLPQNNVNCRCWLDFDR